MRAILHLSDTHFGTEQDDVIEALLRLVRDQGPELIIHSGDVTQRARRHQFRAAAEFLEMTAVPERLVLPGNHDIPLYNLAARILSPYANYQGAFGQALEYEWERDDLLVIGLNTTSPTRHKDGKITEEQIDRVSQRLRQATADQLRIVVAHQPVLVIRQKDEKNLIEGHREAVYAWAEAGADLILGGHIHLPYVRCLRDRFVDLPRQVWAVQAGTALSWRTRGKIPNSVNIIRYLLTQDERHCIVERWDHNPSTHQFDMVEQTQTHLDPP